MADIRLLVAIGFFCAYLRRFPRYYEYVHIRLCRYILTRPEPPAFKQVACLFSASHQLP